MERLNVRLVDYDELEEHAAEMVVAELDAGGERDLPAAPRRPMR